MNEDTKEALKGVLQFVGIFALLAIVYAILTA